MLDLTFGVILNTASSWLRSTAVPGAHYAESTLTNRQVSCVLLLIAAGLFLLSVLLRRARGTLPARFTRRRAATRPLAETGDTSA